MAYGREIQVVAASATIVAAFLVLRWIRNSGSKGNGKRHPPSLPVLPVFGAIYRGGMTALPEHLMRSAEKLGPVCCFANGKILVVVLNGYEAIFDAMVKHSEAFADKLPLWSEVNVLNPEGRGLAFAHYDETFKKYHKLSISILKEFGFGVQRVSETRILQEVETMNAEILNKNGRPFEPKWPITFATSNVVISILFGKTLEKISPNEHSAIVENAAKCVERIDLALNMAPIFRFLPTFRKEIKSLRECGKSLMEAIDAAIEFIKSNNSEPSFVGRFLEIEGADYDHQDLLYILRDMCFASTDTVSTTIQWAIVELANHPEVQNRFQKEIDEMIPGERLPSLDDKPRLPYTEAVILEIMRRRTVVPFFIPHGTLRDTKVLEYDVPKGSLIIPNAYSAHMDQTFWKDPENFRPERFLDAENKIMNAQRVIPFGLGKRSCIGEMLARQTTFLFLTSLVQRFDIRPPEGQDSIKVKLITALTMAPSEFEVRLIPRLKPTQD